MGRVHLVDISTDGFRNLRPGTIAWGPQSNILVGGNGEGKTNCLEAVTVLGNLRSFRAGSMGSIVAHGADQFRLEGRVETTTGVVRLGQRVDPGPPVRRELSINGRSATVPEYLRVLPLVALSGGDRELVSGGPAERRAFLDRFTFLLEDAHFEELRRYRRGLRQRNAALVGGAGDDEMTAWEGRLAAAGAGVVHRRGRTCIRLVAGFDAIYRELRGEGFPDIELRYRGEAELEPARNVSEVEEYYRKRYNETRARDRRTGFTGEGPHRHDLGLRVNGRAVRHVLSSGQIKVVAAALRLASLKQVEEERGEVLPVIIDDVDSELDTAVLVRLIDHLAGRRQLFLSSADRGGLTVSAVDTSCFEVRKGAVLEAAGEWLDE
jgi:DNA replication and repair protein RecF